MLTGQAGVTLAAANSPRSTVISGEPEAMASLMQQLESKEVYCRWVKVSYASHCPQVDPVLNELSARLSNLNPQPGDIPGAAAVAVKEAEVVGRQAAEVDGYGFGRIGKRIAAQVTARLSMGVAGDKW